MTDDDVPARKIEPAATPETTTPKSDAPGKLSPPRVPPAGNFASVWADAFARLKSQRSFRVSKVVNATASRTEEQADFIVYPPDGFVGSNGDNSVIGAGLRLYTVFDRTYSENTISPEENRCIRLFEDFPVPAQVRAVTHLAPDGGGAYEGVVQRSYGLARVELTISTFDKRTGAPGGMLVRILETPVSGDFPRTYYSFSEFNKDPFDPKYRIEDMKRGRVAR